MGYVLQRQYGLEGERRFVVERVHHDSIGPAIVMAGVATKPLVQATSRVVKDRLATSRQGRFSRAAQENRSRQTTVLQIDHLHRAAQVVGNVHRLIVGSHTQAHRSTTQLDSVKGILIVQQFGRNVIGTAIVHKWKVSNTVDQQLVCAGC